MRCRAGTDGWAIPANYPELANGQILRLDWFILFFQFITAVIVSIVASLGAIPQVMSPCHLPATSPSSAVWSSYAPLFHLMTAALMTMTVKALRQIVYLRAQCLHSVAHCLVALHRLQFTNSSLQRQQCQSSRILCRWQAASAGVQRHAAAELLSMLSVQSTNVNSHFTSGINSHNILHAPYSALVRCKASLLQQP